MKRNQPDSGDPARSAETPPTQPQGAGSRRQGRDANRATDGDGRSASATKTAVLVAGMHRSGTSAIARILGILGCDLPKNVLEPHPSNERGFWESPDIVAVNREILVSAGTKQEEWRADEWRTFDPRLYASPQVERFHDRAQTVLERQFHDSPLFVIKDPGICRLLPFWIETLARFGARPLIVSPIRNPLDVAQSLEARDSIQPPIGCLMWLQHVLAAEAASRELTRAFLRYEQLLSEPHAVVDRLEDALGVIWPRRMSDADAEIDSFLSPGLRHHSSEDDRVLRNPRLSAWLRRSFAILDRWARADVQATDTAELDRIRTAFDEATPAFDRAVSVGLTTTRELRTAQEELDQRKKQVGTLTGKLEELRGYAQRLAGELTEQEARIAERDGYADKLTAELAEQEARIAERDDYADKLIGELAERNAEIAERDDYIRKLAGNLAERDARIAAREREMGVLTGARAEHDRHMNEVLADRDRRIDELNRSLAVILGSRSWRLTRPLRGIVAILTGSRGAGRQTAPTGRGPISLVRKFRFHARTYGLRSALRHTRLFIAARLPGARRRRARNAPATRAEPALPRTGPAPQQSVPAPDLGKGIEWGTHSFRFDYDYSPRVRPFEATAAGRRIRELLQTGDTVRETIRTVGRFRERFANIPANATDPREPEWGQTWLPAFDGMLIYALLGGLNPPRYLEIGSGNSTKFARRAIEDLGLSTQIVSVDPYPREEIDALCDHAVRKPVEDADLDKILELLGDGGVVFIDNSHRSFQNSDVTVCFTELVPALPAGTIYGVHDINLPFDYGSWFLEHFYNEQYLLAMYLLGGAGGDRVVMPTWFAFQDDALRPLVQEAMDVETVPADRRGGSSFWLRKG